MAREWSLVTTVAANASIATAQAMKRALVMNGAVYFFAGLDVTFSYPALFKWDGATLTAITNSSSLPADWDGSGAAFRDMCVFNGELFVGLSNGDAASKDRIYKYTGGTSWTLDQELEDESAGFPYPHLILAAPTNQEGAYYLMDADDAYMGIAGKQGTGAGQTTGRMLMRNTSGVYSAVEMPGSTYESPMPQLVGLSKGSRFGSLVTNNRTGADTFRAVQRGAPGPFSNLSGSNVGNRRLIGYADSKSFWSILDGSNWELRYSTDWGVNLTAAGNLERAEGDRSNFVFKDLGDEAIMCAIGSNQAYVWDPDSDTFEPDGAIDGGLIIGDFFTLNNTLYLISTSNITNSVDIWTAGSSCVAKFYYGIEVPVYASDLPFCGVNPGGMALAKSGVVVLGTDGRVGPSVVYGAYPYTGEWVDISGIVPTGTAVTSIKFL